MAHIQRDYIEPEMQGRGSDDQVLEGDDIAFGGLLSLDPARKLGDFDRDRMHQQIAEDLLREDSTPVTVLIGACTIDAVRQSTTLIAEMATSASP